MSSGSVSRSFYVAEATETPVACSHRNVGASDDVVSCPNSGCEKIPARIGTGCFSRMLVSGESLDIKEL